MIGEPFSGIIKLKFVLLSFDYYSFSHISNMGFRLELYALRFTPYALRLTLYALRITPYAFRLKP
jgi:hypothetical protein